MSGPAQAKDVTKGKKKLDKKKEKLKQLQSKLETAETKSSTAKTNYDEQLEKESRTDTAKGRTQGTTTKRRRSIAKLAHNLVMGAIAVGSGKSYFKGFINLGTGTKKAVTAKKVVKVATDLAVTSKSAVETFGEETRKGTIFEPRLKKKLITSKKVRVLKGKKKKIETDIANLTSAYGDSK